jgi:hypothetical protein
MPTRVRRRRSTSHDAVGRTPTQRIKAWENNLATLQIGWITLTLFAVIAPVVAGVLTGLDNKVAAAVASGVASVASALIAAFGLEGQRARTKRALEFVRVANMRYEAIDKPGEKERLTLVDAYNTAITMRDGKEPRGKGP